MALISQMDPTEAGELLYKKFMAAHEANKGGSPEDHPSRDVQKWNRIAATGGMNSEKQIEKGEDDEQPELSAGGNGGNGGPTPAQDGRFYLDSANVPRFEAINAKGETVAILTGDSALLARARQSNPSRAKRMAERIKGYGK
jgi:hypothetical protein